MSPRRCAAHTAAFRRLMRVFSVMWTLLFVLNALLVGSITGIALAGWNAGTMTTAMVATAIPFVLQIMSISGWILEVGSNVFRQLGTARDSMQTIAKPLTLVDAPGAAGSSSTAASSSSTGSASTTGAATPGGWCTASA